jgi:hypothetical protein
MRPVTITVAVVVISACAAPAVGTYPDAPPDNSDLPDRGADPTPATTKAADAGPGGGFVNTKPTITVTLTGTGTGTIASTPGGVTCSGTTCTGTFAKGTAVTLLPTPGAGSVFAGWTGACTGAASCAPVVNDNTQLTAEFGTLEGTWNGTYTNTRPANGCTFNNNGNISVTITKTATAGTFSSTANMTNFEIRNTGCNVVDHRNGSGTANLTASATGVTSTWPIQIQNINGKLDFPFTATVAGKTMNGTWTCPNCTGTFTLTKQ